MLKKVSLALVLASLVSTTALADGSHATTSASGGEDHLVLKARAGYVNTQFDNSKLNAGFTNPNSSLNGYAGELALGYFFTDNIAVEGSAAYSANASNVTTVPVSLLVQYHFIPEASVSPYVGVGYSYQFVTKSPATNTYKNGGGFVGQVGLDIPYNDTMGFNIDAKYTYKASHDLEVNSVKAGTLKLSTTAVTAGVTFSF